MKSNICVKNHVENAKMEDFGYYHIMFPIISKKKKSQKIVFVHLWRHNQEQNLVFRSNSISWRAFFVSCVTLRQYSFSLAEATKSILVMAQYSPLFQVFSLKSEFGQNGKNHLSLEFCLNRTSPIPPFEFHKPWAKKQSSFF